MTAKYRGFTNIRLEYDSRDVTQITESVTWSGDVSQAYRVLTVQLRNTRDGRTKAISIEAGKELRFYHNDEFLFRGMIFSQSINSDGTHSITAYDESIYLTKSNDDRKFTNVKASDVIKRLCSDFGVPMGSISDTGYVIPKLIYRNASLYDMIITALTITEKQNGRRFFLNNNLGKLTLVERGQRVIQGAIEVGSTLMDASYTQSIEELKTRVKVFGGTDKAPVTVAVRNDALYNRFGLMQHVENVDEDLSKAQAEQRARELLAQLGTIEDEATVTALGFTKAIAGASLQLREPMTGIIGNYYVVQDTHSFGSDGYTMSLKLSLTDDLPKAEANADE